VIGSLRLGGSGLGDAIVAWTQGSGAGTQVAAAVVDAPPNPFFVETPTGWRRQPEIGVHWAAAVNAIGGVTYSVSVDDEPVGKETKKLFALLKRGQIGDGRHRIQVFAIDEAGQQTGSRNAVLRVDRTPPQVTLRRQGRRLVVSITDGARLTTSGLKGSSAKVGFGDGSGKNGGGGNKGGAGGGGEGTTISAAGGKGAKAKKKPIVKTIRHAYAKAGTYRIIVSARDRAGNTTDFERKVRVR
jgi:hypothetical protein